MLNLERLECLPTRETHRSNFVKANYYDDDFKKSANQFYNQGYYYVGAVLRKHYNKPVEGLIYRLRHQTKSKHRSFKKAVEDVIKRDLLTNSNWNYFAYVDAQGIVRDSEDYPYKREPYSYQAKPDTKDTLKFIEIDNKFIMRIKGIHYFVTPSYFVYEKFKMTHSYYNRNYEHYANLYNIKVSFDYYRVQLSTDLLKKYNLSNVWE